MASGTLTCREFVELITDYLEEELPSELRRRIEDHLAQCDGCDTYLDQMKAVIALVADLDAAEVPPGVEEGLLAAFRRVRGDA